MWLTVHTAVVHSGAYCFIVSSFSHVLYSGFPYLRSTEQCDTHYCRFKHGLSYVSLLIGLRLILSVPSALPFSFILTRLFHGRSVSLSLSFHHLSFASRSLPSFTCLLLSFPRLTGHHRHNQHSLFLVCFQVATERCKHGCMLRMEGGAKNTDSNESGE